MDLELVRGEARLLGFLGVGAKWKEEQLQHVVVEGHNKGAQGRCRRS